MDAHTAGSDTIEPRTTTTNPFFSTHDMLSDHTEVHRPYSTNLPSYTRRSDIGDDLLQTAADHSTNQIQSHQLAAASFPMLPRNCSTPTAKPPAVERSVEVHQHKPRLERGLQIPTRLSYVTSGFSLPRALEHAGVDKACWKQFSKEAKSHGAMTASQWAMTCGGGFGTCNPIRSRDRNAGPDSSEFASHKISRVCRNEYMKLILAELTDDVLVGVFLLIAPVVPFLFGVPGLVGAGITGHNMRKHREQENLAFAQQSGALDAFAKRWNKEYFEPLGLHVRIEAPNMPTYNTLEEMDVTSTKLFKYREKHGTTSPKLGMAVTESDKKEQKYQAREGHGRVKAARRGRILVMSLGQADVNFSPRTEQSTIKVLNDRKSAWISGLRMFLG